MKERYYRTLSNRSSVTVAPRSTCSIASYRQESLVLHVSLTYRATMLVATKALLRTRDRMVQLRGLAIPIDNRRPRRPVQAAD